MKISFVAALFSLSVLCGSARAGEMDTGGGPSYDWTGTYFGVNGGYGWGEFEIGTSGSSVPVLNGLNLDSSSSGALLGGTLGYNWQTGNFVFGVEGDLDWADISGESQPLAFGGLPSVTRVKLDWLGTLRARAGISADRVLLFATAGLAAGGVKGDTSNFPVDGTTSSSSGTQYGYAAGAGLEVALAGNLSAKIEYMHIDLGSRDYRLGEGSPNALTAEGNPKADLLRFGLNYRF